MRLWSGIFLCYIPLFCSSLGRENHSADRVHTYKKKNTNHHQRIIFRMALPDQTDLTSEMTTHVEFIQMLPPIKSRKGDVNIELLLHG